MKAKWIKRTLQSLSLLAVVGMITSSALAAPGKYTVDGSHTSLIFGISHMGLSYTYGRFNKVEGEFTFDSASPEDSEFNLTIQTGSVDTNDAKRDEHLRGADFFNAKQFSKMEFKSQKIEKTAEGVILHGELTMHGETKPVSVPLKLLGEGKGPRGDARIGFFGQFKLNRSEFGMTNMVGPIGDEVSIMVSFEGILQ